LQRPDVRYIVVGASNTVLGLTIIYLLKWTGDVGDIFANMIGYTCGLIASFIFNAKWTFSYRGRMLSALVRFLIVLLAAYLANLVTVVTAISVYDANGYVAQGLGVVPYTLVGYLGSRFFAFRRRGPARLRAAHAPTQPATRWAPRCRPARSARADRRATSRRLLGLDEDF
jgi:putative flippase GtrA